MLLKKLLIKNFQCFGEEPISIRFDEDVTCLIGNNGSGKSAVLTALRRLFGSSREERTVVKSDFHIRPGETDEDICGKQLCIDVTFEFSELEAADNISLFFPSICQNGEKKLFARMRLEATWNEGEYEDEVTSSLFWVLDEEQNEFEEDDPLKLPVSNHERKHINLIYIPATRDARSILLHNMKRLIRKIERYTDLADKDKTLLEKNSKALGKQISELPLIQEIQQIINKAWTKAHDNSLLHYQNVTLEIVASKFEQLIKSLSLKLSPAETKVSKDVSELSDGQMSLLYLSLAVALYDLELWHSQHQIDGIKQLDEELPIFTIIALEEPENHLSSFYLSRILSLLEERCRNNSHLISIITSHSPNVVRRMKSVERIRFLRQSEERESMAGKLAERHTSVNEIRLPPKDEPERYKYINQAVLAHPELYFAKFVVLGEGDSEEIIFPTIAQKSGYDFDASFVVFVRLNGRHVNHMWHLLDDLKIPHLTLLDYDLGRKHGGEARLKDIAKQLAIYKNIHVPENPEIEQLQKLDIYFSYPLDTDMTMIRSFPEFYSIDAKLKEDSIENVIKAVLGKDGWFEEGVDKVLELYNEDEMRIYRYLFTNKSKVASHYIACDSIREMDEAAFFAKRPKVWGSIVNRIRETLQLPISEEEQRHSRRLVRTTP